MSSAIIRCFEVGSTRVGLAAGDGDGKIRDDDVGSDRSTSSRVFGGEDRGLANSRESREVSVTGCWTGDGMVDCNGVGVNLGVEVDVGIGVDVNLGVGVDVGVAVAFAVGNGDSVGDGVGIGVGVRVGAGAGVDVAVGVGDRDSVGNGEGCSANGSSVGCVSITLVDCSLGAPDGVRLGLDPGSDQSPILLPSAKVVCNRV